jgi:hypothetical protein
VYRPLHWKQRSCIPRCRISVGWQLAWHHAKGLEHKTPNCYRTLLTILQHRSRTLSGVRDGNKTFPTSFPVARERYCLGVLMGTDAMSHQIFAQPPSEGIRNEHSKPAGSVFLRRSRHLLWCFYHKLSMSVLRTLPLLRKLNRPPRNHQRCLREISAYLSSAKKSGLPATISRMNRNVTTRRNTSLSLIPQFLLPLPRRRQKKRRQSRKLRLKIPARKRCGT